MGPLPGAEAKAPPNRRAGHPPGRTPTGSKMGDDDSLTVGRALGILSLLRSRQRYVEANRLGARSPAGQGPR